ncbi:MAG: DUF3780 domain-containing protein [Caldicoprobacter sp.]|uniref:DUF3780 domain-containing protein n=1 Tax=Caldicoprobacter faecalis TaxID=937334 RepID=A0A1I5V0V0_9FIRM|nr:DUF3780 domain-containing protein [Caldicoprobacter faecalis]MBO2494344.1 DUF3780 domain-containing protein [Clostridia bacterium]SFQ00957.1 Protein of unknown function [Caldicoprobacter faecalis]
MAEKRQVLGFGFIPEESQHHFLVIIPRASNGKVIIYERFKWQDGAKEQTIDIKEDRPKVEISKYKWKQIEDTLKNEFNARLKKEKLPAGKWHTGQVPVQRLFGKEMVLLAWAIEDCDPSVIPVAIKNWLGLSPEERWWLFTMTNAATGGLYDKRGWRKAIRYALTENPVEETNKQLDLFDLLLQRKIDD